jgi:hypothetical protein
MKIVIILKNMAVTWSQNLYLVIGFMARANQSSHDIWNCLRRLNMKCMCMNSVLELYHMLRATDMLTVSTWDYIGQIYYNKNFFF